MLLLGGSRSKENPHLLPKKKGRTFLSAEHSESLKKKTEGRRLVAPYCATPRDYLMGGATGASGSQQKTLRGTEQIMTQLDGVQATQRV